MNYLYGIEYLTKDSQGYVYWRGRPIEHYSFRDTDKERPAAEKLAADCQLLESRNLEVSGDTLSQLWQDQVMAEFSPAVQAAARRIAGSYGIGGICDLPYIAGIIADALK